jgi:RimJ/RimL family protein N-acetyltransferase
MLQQERIFQTTRLIIRPLRMNDVEHVYELYSDWEVSKTLSRITFPFTRQAARQFVADAQAALAFQSVSSYILGMFQRDSRSFVGIVALRIPAHDSTLSDDERATWDGGGILGYSVVRSQWNQGFAAEGAQRMVRFAFDELGLKRLQASPLRENPASRRVLERLGFVVSEAGILEEAVYGGPARLADRYVLVRYETKR